jgi:hypothetical protein
MTRAAKRGAPSLAAQNFAAIQAVAVGLGWPTFYKNDLEEHDFNFISNGGPRQAYLWGVAEHGTFIRRLGPAQDRVLASTNKKRLCARRYQRAVNETFPGVRWFVVRLGVARELKP